MTLLTLCMPSNRDLRHSRSSIDTALIYADKMDCQLVVSDNSGDPEKHAYYKNFSPRLTYLVAAAQDALGNMLSALACVETPFVMPMGDDDEIYGLDDRPPFDLSTLPENAIGVRPQTFIWTNEKGVHRVDRFSIAADIAGSRILEYNEKARGNNALYYSIFRSDLFRRLFTFFAQSHPTRGAYCDWAFTLAFCAAGRILYDDSTIYRYDLGRWAERKSLEATKRTLFTQAGLPDNAESFSALLQYIDVHVFLTWSGLPLSEDQRQNALLANAHLALGAFVREVEKAQENYDPEIVYLAGRIGQTRDLSSAFQIALLITDRVQPGLGERYVRFARAATELG